MDVPEQMKLSHSGNIRNGSVKKDWNGYQSSGTKMIPIFRINKNYGGGTYIYEGAVCHL